MGQQTPSRRLTSPSGAVRLGPFAQLCQVQCPLRPFSFPLALAQGNSLNQVSVWRTSRSPVPWGAQIREPSLLPAAKPEAAPRGAQWEDPGGSKETQPRSLRPVLGEGGTRTRTTGGRFGSEFLAPAAIHSARRLCQVVSSPSLGVHARPGWPPVRDSAERVSEGRCQVGMDTGLSLLLPPAV